MRTERESVLHAKDHAGFTPLHYAARNWFPELTDVLLKCGAKVDAFCNRGNTPLHYAAEGKALHFNVPIFVGFKFVCTLKGILKRRWNVQE